MSAIVRAATIDDAVAILPHVIPKQRAALDVLPGGDLLGLQYAIGLSERTICGLADGVPVCLGGVVRSGSMLVPVGMLWMTITPGLARYPKQFLRDSRAVIREWSDIFPLLVDFIDAEKVSTLRWLAWLGFDILPAVPGLSGNQIHPVELRKWA